MRSEALYIWAFLSGEIISVWHRSLCVKVPNPPNPLWSSSNRSGSLLTQWAVIPASQSHICDSWKKRIRDGAPLPVRSITDRVAHQIRYRSSRGQIHIDLLKYFLCFQVQRGRRNREDDAPIAGTLTTRSTQTTKRQDVDGGRTGLPGGTGPRGTHTTHAPRSRNRQTDVTQRSV